VGDQVRRGSNDRGQRKVMKCRLRSWVAEKVGIKMKALATPSRAQPKNHHRIIRREGVPRKMGKKLLQASETLEEYALLESRGRN